MSRVGEILSARICVAEAFETKKHTGWSGKGKAAAWLLVLLCGASGMARAQTDAAWTAFQPQATAWRALAVKPALPATVQQDQSQAEFAMQQNRPIDAAAAYEAALKIDPVWPDGQLKLAQIYAQLSEFDKAVWHMRAYVALVPDSPEALAAPKEINDWTDKANQKESEVFLDKATHLMWARHDSGGHLTHMGAINYCANLNLGNFDGWRVPTSIELKTIYEKNKKNDNPTCTAGNLEGARIRPDIQLSCNEALVWQLDVPYTNMGNATAGCFGFRKAGGELEYASGSLKCPVLCVRTAPK